MDREDDVLKVVGMSVARSDGVSILEAVDLSIRRRRAVALVGETGSGKSCFLHAVLGLLPPGLQVTAGSAILVGQGGPVDLLQLSERQLSRLRGRCIGFVPQHALSGLDPLMTVRDSLREAARVRGDVSIAEADAMADTAMQRAGLPKSFQRAADRRPGALSGGQRQRVLIGQALINDPDLVLYDEPTTALDVHRRNTIHRAIRRHTDAGGSAVIVTHDLLSAASVADEIAVLYMGRVVEHGPSELVLEHPLHPYTQALIECAPRLDRRAPVRPIPGEPPQDRSNCDGCRFHPRCSLREWRCRSEEPRLRLVRNGREVACHAR